MPQVPFEDKQAVDLLESLMKVYTAIDTILGSDSIVTQYDQLKRLKNRGAKIANGLIALVEREAITEAELDSLLPVYKIPALNYRDIFRTFAYMDTHLANMQWNMGGARNGRIPKQRADTEIALAAEELRTLFGVKG